MGRLFGTDGVRGVANTELTCERAVAIGRAAALVLAREDARTTVLIGCDTRISGDMLTCAVAAGLTSAGADVITLGVVPTPAVAYLVTKLGADAGVMISASHNPAAYNGIKIFSGDGYKLPDLLEEQIEQLVLDRLASEGDMPFAKPTGGDVGRITACRDARQMYIEHLISTVPGSLSGLRIALDCANGSASATAEALFTALGAEVHMLSHTPNGVNINEKCGSTHPEALAAYVRTHGLHGGAAFDGDADRCLLVDENGSLIDGDMILSMLAMDLQAQGRLTRNTVVGTVMTNFGFQRFCEANGLRFAATQVGDRFVLEEMLREDYALGGEQSGHIIFREYATTGDGQLTAIQLFALLQRRSVPLSRLNSYMHPCPQVMVNLTVTPEGKLHFYTDTAVKAAVDKARADLGGTGRVVVRPSGTEPLIRVMAEGDDDAAIRQAVDAVASVIEARLGAVRAE